MQMSMTRAPGIPPGIPRSLATRPNMTTMMMITMMMRHAATRASQPYRMRGLDILMMTMTNLSMGRRVARLLLCGAPRMLRLYWLAQVTWCRPQFNAGARGLAHARSAMQRVATRAPRVVRLPLPEYQLPRHLPHRMLYQLPRHLPHRMLCHLPCRLQTRDRRWD